MIALLETGLLMNNNDFTDFLKRAYTVILVIKLCFNRLYFISRKGNFLLSFAQN